jgi:L-rhamnose mutarotase
MNAAETRKQEIRYPIHANTKTNHLFFRVRKKDSQNTFVAVAITESKK